MTNIGRFNDLNILSVTPRGALLDGGACGELLLPAREVPAGSETGGTIRVFVYAGPDDQLTATTAEATAYSKTKSHPMIQAINSPIVA